MNKVITIAGVETKSTSTGKTLIRIKDQESKGYQLWPIKQDGTESVAFQYYKTLPASGINQSVEISYKEEQGSYDGKPVTYRAILGMKKAVVIEQPKQAGTTGKQETDWDKISWGKCKHAYLVEAFKLALAGQLKKTAEEIEEIAEAWADKSMRKLSDKKEPRNEGMEMSDSAQDSINYEEEINVENIPF